MVFSRLGADEGRNSVEEAKSSEAERQIPDNTETLMKHRSFWWSPPSHQAPQTPEDLAPVLPLAHSTWLSVPQDPCACCSFCLKSLPPP